MPRSLRVNVPRKVICLCQFLRIYGMKYFARITISALIKYSILLYHLSLSKHYNAKFTSQHAESPISTNAFTECFLQFDSSLVLIGHFNDTLFHDFPFKSQLIAVRLLGLEKITSIKILAEEKVYKMKESDFRHPLLPANNIFMSNVSAPTVKLIMSNIKYSVLWNLYGRFIIDETCHRNSCANAYAYFKVLWEFEVQNAVFMCRDVDGEMYFFVFNPFSEKIPNGWVSHQRLLQNNGHPLTIFKRAYDRFLGPVSFCEPAVFFDKTTALGGYPVKIMELIAPVSDLPYELHEYGVQVSGTIVDTIWYSLNATLLKSYFPASRRGSIDKAGHPAGLLKCLLQGEFDMQLNLDYERDFWRNQVYTYLESGICYFAWKDVRGEEKGFSSLFSTEIWLLLVSTVAILIVVFRHLLKVSYAQVAVNLLRGILGVYMFYEPKRPLDRVSFYVFVYAFIVLNLYFQSKLLSLLTAPMLKETIQSPYDLIRYGYRVFAEQRFEQYLYDTDFQYYTKRIESVKFCLDIMKSDRKAACVYDCWAGTIMVMGKEFMQLVEDEDLPKYFVHIFKDNFSLIRAYKKRYARLFQSGMLRYLQKVKIRVARSGYELKPDEGPTGLTLGQVKFAFYFLAYGLLGAGLVFLTEIVFCGFGQKKIIKATVASIRRFIDRMKRYYCR